MSRKKRKMPRKRPTSRSANPLLRNAEAYRPEDVEEFLAVLRKIPGYDPFNVPPGFYLDLEAAIRAINFFSDCLTHVKGALAGQAIDLEPWQQAVIGNMFGWKREDGFRRYREIMVYVPRKNGKTTLASGICNYLLFCDGEPGAEIYCAAADAEQAALVFEVAKQQVLREPTLSSQAKIYQRAIVLEQNGSFFRAISKEANTKHGYNSHGLCIDELHAQKDRELVDVLLTSMGSRRQPLVVFITTADYERTGSICNEKHDYASKVRDGIIADPSFLPVIYEAKKDDDWKSPAVWAKANPNLGISVSLEFFQREAQRAQDVPSYENTFKRLFLNIRTEQEIRWISMEKWDLCQEAIDWEQFAGRECYAGLDLSSVRDLTALVLVFPSNDEPTEYYVWPHFWVPGRYAEVRERDDRVPYLTWMRAGFLQKAGEESIDQTVVFKRIMELRDKYSLRSVAYDPWNGEAMAQALDREGFEVVKFPQSFANLSEPSKEFEKAILSGRLHHDGNPILRWNASNVTATENDGNIRPSKKKSPEKIDGIVATVMGIALTQTGRKAESIYNTRGMLIL